MPESNGWSLRLNFPVISRIGRDNMVLIHAVREMQAKAEELRNGGKTVGFVPTMGYLHEGHLSLVRLAREKADTVVVSVFVNPSQFGPNEDLDSYPRDLERDVRLAASAGADIVFHPEAGDMYPAHFFTAVTVSELTRYLCGKSRPAHFQGVTTVCAKLFNIVKPHFAVFGQKDFQQSVIIQKMVRDLNFDLEIITAPIIREADGLAMSSRNKYLSDVQRKEAVVLHRSLLDAEEMIVSGERDPGVIREAISNLLTRGADCTIDYIEVVDPETFQIPGRISRDVLIALAVKFGTTRLIDNIRIKVV